MVKLSLMKNFNVFGAIAREISTNLVFSSNNFHTNSVDENVTLCPWLGST